MRKNSAPLCLVDLAMGDARHIVDDDRDAVAIAVVEDVAE
jgi:hypothetical protein